MAQNTSSSFGNGLTLPKQENLKLVNVDRDGIMKLEGQVRAVENLIVINKQRSEYFREKRLRAESLLKDLEDRESEMKKWKIMSEIRDEIFDMIKTRLGSDASVFQKISTVIATIREKKLAKTPSPEIVKTLREMMNAEP